MALQRKRKTRMYEPWGYRDENNYQSSDSIYENELDDFFASASYVKDDNKIHFANKNGEDVATLNVDDFVQQGQIIEKVWYEDGKLYIKFTNGDLVTIDIGGLIPDYEFKDGLQESDGVVSLAIDPSSEKWITVSENGVKIDGIQSEIDRLDEKIDDEQAARESSDEELNTKIEDETARAIEAEEALNERIDEIASGSTSEKLDELIEKLGYDNNDTLETNNEHDVAFGEYNLNNETTEPSGKTVFSVGIGTSDDDRKNAIEVRKDGEVYLWIEGEYMSINKLLGQIAHELYD